ncbi:hypothetical protein [Armatimonas rosea]|uniref:Uncharacterized protein n=1 Tax=Armatimonas rosea TaxID=685828 RepID=A0A7W9SLR8_ARMRO|nr:hypothetical protein [Armatimonas rosea]MBB6048655.1 hypothetical protein [Armatimonas rosea]
MSKTQQSLLWLKRGLLVALKIGGALGGLIAILLLKEPLIALEAFLILLVPCLVLGALCTVTVPWVRSRTVAGILPGLLLALVCALREGDTRLLILAVPTCLFGLLINALADPYRSTPEYQRAMQEKDADPLAYYPKGLKIFIALVFVCVVICGLIAFCLSLWDKFKKPSPPSPLLSKIALMDDRARTTPLPNQTA